MIYLLYIIVNIFCLFSACWQSKVWLVAEEERLQAQGRVSFQHGWSICLILKYVIFHHHYWDIKTFLVIELPPNFCFTSGRTWLKLFIIDWLVKKTDQWSNRLNIHDPWAPYRCKWRAGCIILFRFMALTDNLLCITQHYWIPNRKSKQSE